MIKVELSRKKTVNITDFLLDDFFSADLTLDKKILKSLLLNLENISSVSLTYEHYYNNKELIDTLNKLEFIDIYIWKDENCKERIIGEKDEVERKGSLSNYSKDEIESNVEIKQVIAKKPKILSYEQALKQNISCLGSIMYSHDEIHWNSAGFDPNFWPENVKFTSILTEFDI